MYCSMRPSRLPESDAQQCSRFGAEVFSDRQMHIGFGEKCQVENVKALEKSET